MVWAIGLNEPLEQGYTVTDGFQIAENIFNMTWKGTSGDVIIDHVGDTHVDTRYWFVELIRKHNLVCLYFLHLDKIE